MALKVKITTDDNIVKVIKDNKLLFTETICKSHEIQSPLRELYNHLGINFGSTIEVEVQVKSNELIKTVVYKDNEIYYKESVYPSILYSLDHCLFFKVHWLFFQDKFGTSDTKRINLLQSEVREIKEKLNTIELVLNPQEKQEV